MAFAFAAGAAAADCVPFVLSPAPVGFGEITYFKEPHQLDSAEAFWPVRFVEICRYLCGTWPFCFGAGWGAAAGASRALLADFSLPHRPPIDR